MDAAAEEFAEHGFHQASMNRLVKRLGIAKGSLFKYFGTKEGLFEALFARSLVGIKNSLRNAADTDGDFFERITGIILAALSFIDKHPRLYRIYLKLLFQENAPLRGKIVPTVQNYATNFLRPLVQDGIKSGQLRQDLDVDSAVFLLMSILERFLQAARVGGIDDSVFGQGAFEAHARTGRIMQLLRQGLGPTTVVSHSAAQAAAGAPAKPTLETTAETDSIP